MPRRKEKKPRIERTDDWQMIKQRSLWPEQRTYELIRPVVLFSETPSERAKETHEVKRTLYRQVERFEEQGMGSLFTPTSKQREDLHRSVPVAESRPAKNNRTFGVSSSTVASHDTQRPLPREQVGPSENWHQDFGDVRRR